MWDSETDKKLVDRFWEQVERRAAIAEICRRLGKDAGFLYFQCYECEDGPRQRTLIEAGAAAGFPRPEELYFERYEGLDDDPCGALEWVRECQGLKPDPLLEEMKPRLTALAAAPVDAAGDWTCSADEIWQLDQLRRRDRLAAAQKLEKVLRSTLGRLEAEATKPRRGISQLCLILFVFAAIYRLAGRRDDTLDWLKLAWQLVQKTADFLLRGFWYQRALYLAVDLSYPARALHFAKQAHTSFAIAGAEHERLGALVDMAYVLTHAGRHEESRTLLEAVLPQLERADHASRISTHELLASNFQALGDLESARKHLAEAIKLVGEDNLARATCLWRLGKLLVQLGDAPAALSKFGEAMPLYAKLSGAAELAELAMEYAALLHKEKRRPELRLLAADLTRWFKEIKAHLRLRNLVADFKALVELDMFTEREHQELLVALAEAKEALRVVKHRLRAKPAKKD